MAFSDNIFKPHLLTGFIITALRTLFSDPENIEDPDLRNYYWNNDPKISNILIGHKYDYTADEIQRRPAILVNNKGGSLGILGIGNKLQNTTSGEVGFIDHSIPNHLSGKIAVTCVAPLPLETSKLTFLVFEYLAAFSNIIRKQTCLAHFSVSRFTGVNVIDEYREHFAAKVEINYIADKQFVILRQTPEWAKISLDNLIN